MTNLTKKQKEQLKAYMPDFKSDLDLKLEKLLEKIEVEFSKGLATYVSKKYINFREVLKDVLLHNKEGYELDIERSFSSPSGNGSPIYTVYYIKPKNILDKEKKSAIASAKESIKQQLETLETQWVEQELEKLRKHQKQVQDLEKRKQEQENKFKVLGDLL